MELNHIGEYITRSLALGIVPNIDGWIYGSVNGEISLVGFDKDIFESYKKNKILTYDGICEYIIIDFDLLNECLQSYAPKTFRRQILSVDEFVINNIKVLYSNGTLKFAKSLYLNDTEVLTEKSLLNSTVEKLYADKVVDLGSKCLFGCNNITHLSLKSKVDLLGSDIENLRCLIRLYKLELGDGAKIVDEDYYKYRNGRNIIFEHLDLSNVKKISSNILIHLLELNSSNSVHLNELEEIVMYNNSKNLRHYLKGSSILLDKLKVLEADLFYNLSCQVLSLKSLNFLVKYSFNQSRVNILYLPNVKSLEEDSFVNCTIMNLYLNSLDYLDLNSFRSCKVKTLYLSKSCRVSHRVDSSEFRSIFHELQRV